MVPLESRFGYWHWISTLLKHHFLKHEHRKRSKHCVVQHATPKVLRFPRNQISKHDQKFSPLSLRVFRYSIRVGWVFTRRLPLISGAMGDSSGHATIPNAATVKNCLAYEGNFAGFCDWIAEGCIWWETAKNDFPGRRQSPPPHVLLARPPVCTLRAQSRTHLHADVVHSPNKDSERRRRLATVHSQGGVPFKGTDRAAFQHSILQRLHALRSVFLRHAERSDSGGGNPAPSLTGANPNSSSWHLWEAPSWNVSEE